MPTEAPPGAGHLSTVQFRSSEHAEPRLCLRMAADALRRRLAPLIGVAVLGSVSLFFLVCEGDDIPGKPLIRVVKWTI